MFCSIFSRIRRRSYQRACARLAGAIDSGVHCRTKPDKRGGLAK